MSLPSAFQASGPLPSATFSGWDAQTEQAAIWAVAGSGGGGGSAVGPANAIQFSDGAGAFQGTANGTLTSAGALACDTLATTALCAVGGNITIAGNQNTLGQATIGAVGDGNLFCGAATIAAALGSGAPNFVISRPAPSVPTITRFTGSSILTGGGAQAPIPGGAGSLGEALSWGLGRAVGGVALVYCWGTTTATAYGAWIVSYVPNATTNPLALNANILSLTAGAAGLAALGQNGGTAPVSWLVTNNNATQAYNFSVLYLV